MAYENPTKVLSFPANGDLSGFQFYPVTILTTGRITTTATTTDVLLGVLQDTPSAQDEMAAVAIEGVTKIVAYGGAITAFSPLGVTTGGVAAATTTDNQQIVARSLEQVADAGTNLVISALLTQGRY